MESPSKWDRMPQGNVCHVVVLDPKSTEYAEVKSKFENTMPSTSVPQPVPHLHNLLVTASKYASYSGQWSHIVKIERIQNPFLYGQYVAKKKIMDQHNSKHTVNERELFHGCPEDVTGKISHHGFNRSFAGKNGIKSCSYSS